jgi:hypothetical protein
MPRNWLHLTVCLLTVAVASPSFGQQQADVRRVMTVAEFKDAGLDKLTPDEMKALNAWFGRYLVRLYSSVASAPERPPASTAVATPDVIETQTDGEFNGWDGETIFKLANGQIWQQDSYAYTYHYAYRPKVLIYKSGATYRMKVDGVTDTISVKRIK